MISRRTASAALGILAISVPTLAVEENWHGRPLIDQPGAFWVIPTVIVLAAFFAGGAFARRSALTAGALAAVALDLADIVRRAEVTHQATPAAIWGLWALASVVSVLTSVLGGTLASRRLQPAPTRRRV